MRPRTKLLLTSSQPRMHRSQRMQASWSTAMAREESSLPRATKRFAKRGWETPAAFERVSNSQSPEFCWRAQGEGWSDIMSSRTVFRAAKTFSELVTTFIPGSTGRTQEAARTRAPVSTTQRRQTPTGVWCCRWQSVGMLTPLMRAASKTVVPAGTRTGCPSRMRSTMPEGVVAVVILWTNSNSLGFPGARCGSETNSTGTSALQNVRIHFRAKVFQHGLNRRRHGLPESANRSEAHGLREFLEKRQVTAILRLGNPALRPAREHVRHFLRADAARDALPAGFVAIKAHGVQRHVQHASCVVANDDSAGAEHGAGLGECFEVETNINHRSWQIAGRRSGRREGFQLSPAANATGVIENNLAHRHAHRDFKNPRARNVAADTDEFQAARAACALRDEPIDAVGENLRNVDESFDVIDDRGFLPQADLTGEGWLIARLGAMTFDGFDQRALFATDIAAGANKNFQVVIEIAAEDFFSEKPCSIATANLFAEDFFLQMVLVANIKDAALRAGHQPGDDHAFDQQMRQIGHDEAVLDGAGLAFVRVADNVFDRIGLFADEIPLHAGGKSGAAHAFQFGSLKLCEHVVPRERLNEFAHDAVFFAVAIRIGFAHDACLFGMRLVHIIAAYRAAGELLGMRCRDIRENVIVDGNRGRMIAAAQAGDVPNLHIFRSRIGEATLQIGAQFASAIEAAAHVRANANFGFGRRHEMKMGIKTRNAVDLIKR